MIYQLHHQKIDPPYSSEFVAQRDCSSKELMEIFIDETQMRFTSPPRHRWMICNEDDISFIRTDGLQAKA